MGRRGHSGGVPSAGAHVGRRNAFVGVGSLLGLDLLVGRLAGAAADGDCPEEAGGGGECDGEPDPGHHVLAERGVDVVDLHRGLDDADLSAIKSCGGNGSGEDKDGLSLWIQLALNLSLWLFYGNGVRWTQWW